MCVHVLRLGLSVSGFSLRLLLFEFYVCCLQRFARAFAAILLFLDLGHGVEGNRGLPIVSIVVPFFGLTKYIIRIL